jgi:hypothetical protein
MLSTNVVLGRNGKVRDSKRQYEAVIYIAKVRAKNTPGAALIIELVDLSGLIGQCFLY